MTDPAAQPALPIACTLDRQELAQRERTLRAVCAGAAEVRELPDGYALRFPGDSAQLAILAEVIAAERDCCPFFRFALELEPGHGPIWLSLRGPEGTKEFVRPLMDAQTAGSPPPAR